MLKRKVKLIALTLIAMIVCVVVYQSYLSGRSCRYSRIRDDANQRALDDDFSRAMSAEKLAFRNLNVVEEDLRGRANEESLDRLATFAMACGKVAESVGFRNRLVELLRERKHRNYSIKLQEELLENAKQVAGLDAAAQAAVFEATAAQFQADLYFRNEQPGEAIKKLNHAVKKFDSVLGAENLLTALISGRLIDLKLRYGGMPEALKEIEVNRRVLAAQLGADHPETIKLLTVKATHHEVRADWPQYIACFESYLKKLAETESYNKQQLIAIANRQLAFGYSRSLQFDRAAQYFDESKELTRKLYGEPSIEMAQWKFLRAADYVGTGEWKEGESLLNKSLLELDELEANHSGRWNEPTIKTIRRTRANTIHRQALCALYDQGLDKEHRLARGKKAFLEAKNILDELGLKKSLRYVFVLRQLCEIEHLTKTDFPELESSEALAKGYIDEACRIYRSLYGQEFGPYYRLLQFYRIATARAWGRYDQAINACYEAVNSRPINSNKTHIAMCLRELGFTYAAMGQPAEAVKAYSEAIDIYGECFFLELLSSSDSQADGYAEFSRDCLKDMIAAGDKSNPAQVEIMFEYVSRIKGMVARAQAMRSQIGGQVDSTTGVDVPEKLFEVGEKIFNLILEKAKTPKPDPEIDDQIRQLSRQKRDLVARLGNSISFDEIKFESNIISRLSEHLPVNTTLVEFYRQPENQIVEKNIYYAFIFRNLDDGYELECKKLGNADLIDEIVNRHIYFATQRMESGNVASKFDTNGDALRKKILDDISPCFGDSEVIVICGDGLLGSVPWSGLPSRAKPGQYLVHDFVMVPATNSRDLVENLVTIRPLGEGSLLVGNLEFGTSGKKGSANPSFAFQQLKESERELQIVGPLLSSFGAVNTLQNRQANEIAVKKQLRLVRFVHFATHGFFLEAEKQGFKALPFARIGLALSDANDPDDHSFLSGEQVISMNLTNLELVVLSACDTSQGLEISGEGIFGMQRAFLMAGAKTCIASRWPVDDAVARQFMELFYENLVTARLSKIEAIRKAQIQMHKLGHPPESWANWQLLGDWR